MIQNHMNGRPDLWPPLEYEPNAMGLGSAPYGASGGGLASRRFGPQSARFGSGISVAPTRSTTRTRRCGRPIRTR